MKKLTGRTLFLIISLSLLLAACRSSGGQTTEIPPTTDYPALLNTATPEPTAPPTVTPTPDGTKGTISIWHSWDESRLPLLVAAIDSFRAAYPDVNFDVLYVPPEVLLQRYITTAREGWGPALLFGPGEWAPALFRDGVVADLTDLEADGWLDGLTPAGVQAMRDGGRLAGLPYRLDGVVLYRNPGLAIQAPENVDHWVTLAQGAQDDEVLGAVLDLSFTYSGAHLNGIGGELIGQDGFPAFNDDYGVAWLELLRSLERVGPVENGNDNDLELFKAGKAAFIVDATWNLPSIIEALGQQNVAIDLWPAYGDLGHLSGYVWAEGMYLNPLANEIDRAAALRFMGHFLSPEVQASLAGAGLIPVLSGLQAEDALVTDAIQALQQGTAYPTLPEIVVYPPEMDIAIRAYLSEGVEAQAALQAADQAIADRLAFPTTTPEP